MKTSTIIRFVLAALFATLACVSLFAGFFGAGASSAVAWLLLMGRTELTKPIPRGEWWVGLLGVGVFVAIIVALHLFHLPEPHGAVRLVVSVALWLLWMWGIYYRWQKEKGKIDA